MNIMYIIRLLMVIKTMNILLLYVKYDNNNSIKLVRSVLTVNGSNTSSLYCIVFGCTYYTNICATIYIVIDAV